MRHYVLMETRDPFENNDADFLQSIVQAWTSAGNRVTIFLAQNGVLAARKKARSGHLRRLSECGASIRAEEFSLQERSITRGETHPFVKISAMDALIELMSDPETRVIWH